MEYELNELIKNIQSRDRISISYIQRTFSYGFTKAGRIFNELVEKGYVSKDGKVLKDTVTPGNTGLKVLFLDIDGVLNCHSTKDSCGKYIGIDDGKVELLKEIIDATGAIIVLVSTWKECWASEPRFKANQDELATYLDEKLAKHGLTAVDKTIDGDSFRRGKGILRYIELQKERGIDINKYVILDDEMFDYLETKLTRHLIQTSFYQNGLEKKHVRKAIERLC